MDEAGRNLVFIHGNQRGKVKAADQKLVRSHSKRSKHERRKAKVSRTTWIPYENESAHRTDMLVLSFPVSPGTHETTAPSMSGSAQRRRQHLRSYESHQPVEKTVVSGSTTLLLVPFIVELDSPSMNLLHTIYPGLQKAFSVQSYGIRSSLHSPQWRDWLLSDVAYLHAILATSSAIQDVLVKRKPSNLTLWHLSKSINQLNDDMTATCHGIKDVMVATIISLCVMSLVSCDRAAMAAHGNGLREIVRLHGGLQSFQSDPQFIFILTRIDLCLCLISGQPPILQDETELPASILTTSILSCSDGEYSSTGIAQYVKQYVDPRVGSIFQFLQSLARAINITTSGTQILTETDLHTSIRAAQYQLFQLEGTLAGILSECLRVTMLAFLTTTFQLLETRIRYTYTAERLRELSLGVEASTPQLQELMFWILMVGMLAFFDDDEPWLQEKWQFEVLPMTKGLHWEQARQILQKYIWIDHCNTAGGQRIFIGMTRGLKKRNVD